MSYVPTGTSRKISTDAHRFCYERGLLASASPLLTPAKDYCTAHQDKGGARLLADIHGGLGSVDSETNQFQGMLDNFRTQWQYIQRAFAVGELQHPSICKSNPTLSPFGDYRACSNIPRRGGLRSRSPCQWLPRPTPIRRSGRILPQMPGSVETTAG